jgi:hypothetical protein
LVSLCSNFELRLNSHFFKNRPLESEPEALDPIFSSSDPGVDWSLPASEPEALDPIFSSSDPGVDWSLPLSEPEALDPIFSLSGPGVDWSLPLSEPEACDLIFSSSDPGVNRSLWSPPVAKPEARASGPANRCPTPRQEPRARRTQGSIL